MQFEDVLGEAHEAARKAQLGMTEGYGLDCGFAWVKIEGNSALARYCRKLSKMDGHNFPMSRSMSRAQRYGGKGWPTGWTFWCPGNFRGQSVGVHEKGAKAFRDVLAKYNIRADMMSRLD